MQSFQKAQKHSSVNQHEGNIAAVKEIDPITTIYKEVTNLLFKITLQMSVGKRFFRRMEMQYYMKKSEVNNFQPMLYHWIVFSFWSNFLIVFCLYQLLTEKCVPLLCTDSCFLFYWTYTDFWIEACSFIWSHGSHFRDSISG